VVLPPLTTATLNCRNRRFSLGKYDFVSAMTNAAGSHRRNGGHPNGTHLNGSAHPNGTATTAVNGSNLYTDSTEVTSLANASNGAEIVRNRMRQQG
jgi:hypothetical protein